MRSRRYASYRAAHASRVGETSPWDASSEGERGKRITGHEAGAGTAQGREATRSGVTVPPVRRRGTGTGALAPGHRARRFAGGSRALGQPADPRGTPTAPGGRSAASDRGHGQPGQRDGVGRATGRRFRRRSRAHPATGVGSPTRPGRFGVRAELAPVASPVRVPTLATGPRVTAAIGSGFRPRAVGQPAETGREKGHCPPHLSGSDGQWTRSSGRLAPEDRPMVDRPTLGRPREGAPASVGSTARGLLLFTTARHRCWWRRNASGSPFHTSEPGVPSGLHAAVLHRHRHRV